MDQDKYIWSKIQQNLMVCPTKEQKVFIYHQILTWFFGTVTNTRPKKMTEEIEGSFSVRPQKG